MKLRHHRKSSDPSPFRPSLLMRLLLAEGPGTVLVKGYGIGLSNHPDVDCVHDFTSHSLLRTVLNSYSHFALPNAHYYDEQKPQIATLVKSVASPLFKIATGYARFSEPGLRQIELLNTISSLPSEDYRPKVAASYQLPRTGPTVIVGSPEGYFGYRVNDAERRADPTELEELLNESGYMKSIRCQTDLEKRSQNGVGLNGAFEGVKDDFEDIGVLHIGRTQNHQLVVVLAGASSPYGTYGMVRAAMDPNRHEINDQVAQFIDGTISEVTLVYHLRPLVGNEIPKRLWFDSHIPVDAVPAELSASKLSKSYSVLKIRDMESNLDRYVPSVAAFRRERSKLASYLDDLGPVTALIKEYPEQIQDDYKAKDLLEVILPDTYFTPVLSNAPQDLDFKKHLTNTTNVKGQDLIATEEHDREFLACLKAVDFIGYQRIVHWRSLYDMEAAHGLVQSDDVSPSGPLVILGAPESFQGWVDSDADSSSNAHSSQLAEILNSVNYPNRYQFFWNKESRGVEDKKWLHSYFDQEKAPEGAHDSVGSDGLCDHGLVYLTRSQTDRVVLVVAGTTWTGTAAGIQLMFEEKRAGIEGAVTKFFEGKLRHVEILFECRRLAPDKGYAVTVLNEDEIEEGFVRNVLERTQEFKTVFKCLNQNENLSEPKEIQLDDLNHWTFESIDRFKQLTIQAAPTLFGNDVLFLSGSSKTYLGSKTYIGEMEEISKAAKQAWQKHEDPRLGFCFGVLILGEQGVGKTAAAREFHRRTRSESKFVHVNIAAITDTLVMSEMFGTREGAFNDAKYKDGQIKKAEGGTLFADEFTEGGQEFQNVFQASQNVLLEKGVIQPAMADKDENLTVRLNYVAASNRATNEYEWHELVAAKRMRPDLWDRFRRKIEIPPLRRRPIEILPTFLQSYCSVSGSSEVYISGNALIVLLTQEYRGNFRQLLNASRALGMRSIKSSEEEPLKLPDIAKELLQGDKSYSRMSQMEDVSPTIRVCFAECTEMILSELWVSNGAVPVGLLSFQEAVFDKPQNGKSHEFLGKLTKDLADKIRTELMDRIHHRVGQNGIENSAGSAARESLNYIAAQKECVALSAGDHLLEIALRLAVASRASDEICKIANEQEDLGESSKEWSHAAHLIAIHVFKRGDFKEYKESFAKSDQLVKWVDSGIEKMRLSAWYSNGNKYVDWAVLVKGLVSLVGSQENLEEAIEKRRSNAKNNRLRKQLESYATEKKYDLAGARIKFLKLLLLGDEEFSVDMVAAVSQAHARGDGKADKSWRL